MDSLRSPPDDPLPLAGRWLDDAARSEEHNPWAMSLATIDIAAGRPANRFVLLKGLDTEQGFAVFYTNYGSRKAAELDGRPRAAGALYWPRAGRQLRLEGVVSRSPAAESDTYFASRPLTSQLNAWASEQSKPVPVGGLGPVLDRCQARFGAAGPVPRPPHWGGYRIWLDVIEFWVEGTARFHERVRYERALRELPQMGFIGTDWRQIRLQP